MESHGILDNRQHGFRRNYSTSSAIFEVTQYLYENADLGKVIYCAFIDYSKAFDTLDHNILIGKLRNISASFQVQEWCRSYLVNRKQQVKNNSDLSDELTVYYGVPQGSILGPLFFIIYVNDLLRKFGEHDPNITLYADDTVLYIASATASEACKKLENGLSTLYTWCVKNKLTINIKRLNY